MFQLPKEISVSKNLVEGNIAFDFRHNKLGHLGRILVQGLKHNQSHFVCEVSGDPEDPDTQKRMAIFQPLSSEIMKIIEQKFSDRPRVIPAAIPDLPKPETNSILSKQLLCEKCNTPVAMLFFPDDALEESSFQDYARLIFPELRKLNVPTWIVGPETPLEKGRSLAKTLKIWPEKHPSIEIFDSDTFNKTCLSPLISGHCERKS